MQEIFSKEMGLSPGQNKLAALESLVSCVDLILQKNVNHPDFLFGFSTGPTSVLEAS
jgi:hypothetical protein